MEQKTYDKIKAELEEQDLFLNEMEIDTVLRLARRAEIDAEHVGIRPERCKDNNREMAFHKHWLKENKIDFGLNSGRGILQGLFADNNQHKPALMRGFDIEITKRERMIAATVIQWLGSNVGFCFLQETLKDCGYEIRASGQTGS
jgi:hypothetical protein